VSRGFGDLSSGVANKKKSAIPDSSRTNYQKEKGQVENLSRFHPGTKLFKISKVDSSSTKKITSILDRVYSGEAEEFIDLYNIRL